jgi:hypothetical protein
MEAVGQGAHNTPVVFSTGEAVERCAHSHLMPLRKFAKMLGAPKKNPQKIRTLFVLYSAVLLTPKSCPARLDGQKASTGCDAGDDRR